MSEATDSHCVGWPAKRQWRLTKENKWKRKSGKSLRKGLEKSTQWWSLVRQNILGCVRDRAGNYLNNCTSLQYIYSPVQCYSGTFVIYTIGNWTLSDYSYSVTFMIQTTANILLFTFSFWPSQNLLNVINVFQDSCVSLAQVICQSYFFLQTSNQWPIIN